MEMEIRLNLDRILLEKNHMKIPALQKLSGVNKNTLYAIYNNDITRIDLSVIARICRALNCQPGDLMTYIPNNE